MKPQKKNKEVIEHFGFSAEFGDDGEGALAGVSKTSFTKTAFCLPGMLAQASSKSPRPKRKGQVSLVPNTDQMSSEFSKFNPIWIAFPLLNLIFDILKMIFEVFFFVFKIVFFKTYEILVPKSFNFGLKSGKKYCFNLLTFRMLITFLCPPMGVFMAYGVRGFVQIGICAVLSLLLYIPGLVYGLVVILRSDVAEYIEQTELNVCNDDRDTSIFMSDEDDKPKCSRGLGEACSVDGKPLPGDSKRLDCCIQAKWDGNANDGEGRWVWDKPGGGGDEAQKSGGGIAQQKSDVEVQCKVDFKTKLAPTKGICVYKSSQRPN